MKTYETNGYYKHSERDNWEHGCQDDYRSDDGHFLLTSGTLDDLLGQMLAIAGVERKDAKESVELNACDEAGRVDISLTENDDGLPATEGELTRWKAGEIDLWYATYTFHVQEVNRFDVRFACEEVTL